MMHFYKLQATGNDFIFFLREENIPSAEKLAQLCHRQKGVGADGIAFISPVSANQYQWRFFNADGAEAEMCGNAARAAVRLLSLVDKQKDVHVKTMKSFFSGRVLGDSVMEITFPLPKVNVVQLENVFASRFPKAYLTNTGVPHCVIPVADLAAVLKRSAELKEFIYDKNFGSAGANLTFYKDVGANQLEAATLERGLNDFTLSCGTGVIAAAQIYQYLNPQLNGPVKVQAPGGELVVDISQKSQAVLRGEAQLVFEGSLP